MDNLFASFEQAYTAYDGISLSDSLSPLAPPGYPTLLKDFYKSTNAYSVRSDLERKIQWGKRAIVRNEREASAWVDVFVAYWTAIGLVVVAEDAHKRGRELDAGWPKVYEAWKELTQVLCRGYSSAGFEAWTLPCLYIVAKHLRIFAIKADEQPVGSKLETPIKSVFQDDIVSDAGQNEKLEDAARVINRIFQICFSDRAPLDQSRKWGIYYTTNLLFKTYFKLNHISLCKNILRALKASSTDMPPLESFPKSHIVTFEYYVGVIHFLEEDYQQAEEHLAYAYRLCLPSSVRNRELILTYLIPTHLMTNSTLPSASLLATYPKLKKLFAPIKTTIRRGDLSGFDAALAAGEDEFVKRRIYLTMERGRDIALRNLLRKVFLYGGPDAPVTANGESTTAPVRRTRIPVREFGVAIGLGRGGKGRVEKVEEDEVECLLANMIYKDLMKGYISHEKGTVVLAKAGVFPGTGV